MKQKILFFQGSIDMSGAIKSTLKVAAGLKNVLDSEVLIATGMIDNNIYDEIDKNLKLINFNKRLRYQLWDLFILLLKEKPNVVISSIPSSSFVAYLATVLSFSKTKLIVIERTSPTIEVKLHKSWVNRLYTHLRKLVYPRSSAVVAVSKGVKEELVELINLDPSFVDVIYNPAITNEKLSKGNEGVNHKWIGTKTPLIVGLGRLEAQKDFATLIHSFAKVQQEINSKLLIIGEGEEREALENLIYNLNLTDKVELAGFKSNPYPYLREADLFVLSSAWEGLPNVLLEAMAFGTSVVSTNCKSGPNEILENGALAPLVPVGDVDAMAAAIVNTLRTPQEPKSLIDRANIFNETQSITQYAKLINKILKE